MPLKKSSKYTSSNMLSYSSYFILIYYLPELHEIVILGMLRRIGYPSSAWTNKLKGHSICIPTSWSLFTSSTPSIISPLLIDAEISILCLLILFLLTFFWLLLTVTKYSLSPFCIANTSTVTQLLFYLLICSINVRSVNYVFIVVIYAVYFVLVLPF